MARSGVIYGGTGTFKTSQVKWLARHIAATTGKRTLLLSCDGGGWEPCRPEVEAGMISAFRVDSATVPLPMLQLVSRGYWPEHPDADSPAGLDFRPIDWRDVGAMAVEGWTSIGAVVMRYLPASGISVGGEDRAKLGGWSQPVTVDGQVMNMNFLSNTRGDFGFVQNQLYGLVMNFNALPCQYVLYTALESKTEDDDRTTIYGPSIPGKKATSQCGAWVGDMIHAQDYQVPRNVQVPNPKAGELPLEQTVFDVTVRYFYKRHPDPATGILFPAKPRVAPERIAELEARFPGGYFEPTADGHGTFADYIRVVDELAGGGADALRDWRKQADALLGRK